MARVRMLRHGPSQGARELRRALGIRAIRFVRTKFRPRQDDLILNWGCGTSPFERRNHGWINHPGNVAAAQDKLVSMYRFRDEGVPRPDFTTDSAEAAQWLRDGSDVVCRRLLRASGGRGISLVKADDWNNEMGYGVALPNAPLYTRYVKKKDEYRVHVVDGEVIDVQQKRRRRERDGEEHVSSQIRNSDNGWVYCREEVQAPEAVIEAGRDAVRALALDFGAADVGWNEYHGRPTVYEVNTAPGLQGTTIRSYADALRRALVHRGCFRQAA